MEKIQHNCGYHEIIPINKIEKWRLEDEKLLMIAIYDSLRECAAKLESQWHRDKENVLPESYQDTYSNAFRLLNDSNYVIEKYKSEIFHSFQYQQFEQDWKNYDKEIGK